MAKFIGRREALWIRQENPRLSGNTSGGTWIRWKSKDTQNKAEHVQNMGATGNVFDNTGTQVAKRYSETSLEFDFYDEYSQLVSNFICGNSGTVYAGTGIASGTNIPVTNTNEPTTYTIGYSGLDNMWVSSGNIVKSITINSDASNSEFVGVSVDFVGTEFVSGALPAVTFVTDSKKITPANSTLYLSSGTSPFSGLRKVKSFSFSAERNAEADYAVGSVHPTDFFAKQFQYKIEATVNTDTTNTTDADSGFYKHYYQSGTDVIGWIRLSTARALSGVATHIWSSEYRGNITDYKQDTPLDDIVTQTFTITGGYRLSTSAALLVTYQQSGNYT